MEDQDQNRLSRTEKAVHELVPIVEQLATSVGDLRKDIKEQGRVLHERIDDQQKMSRPQWTVMVTALGGVLTALIALLVLHTKPIEARTKANENWITQRSKDLITDYYQFGKNTAMLQDALDEVNKLQVDLHDTLEKQGEYEAKIHYLHDWVRDIDQGGSRTWVKPKRGEND